MKQYLTAIALTFVGTLPLACESTISIEPTQTAGSGGNSNTTATASSSGSAGSPGDKGGSGGTSVGTGECDSQTPLPNPPPPLGGACNCGAVAGIVFNGECGGLVLAAPFDRTNPMGPYCDPETAFATSYICKQWFSYTVNACVAPNVAPCIQIKHENYDSAGEVRNGTFVDGTGQTWNLTEVVFGDTNVLSEATSFKALATNSSGQTMTLTGTIDVCMASTSVCPI